MMGCCCQSVCQSCQNTSHWPGDSRRRRPPAAVAGTLPALAVAGGAATPCHYHTILHRCPVPSPPLQTQLLLLQRWPLSPGYSPHCHASCGSTPRRHSLFGSCLPPFAAVLAADAQSGSRVTVLPPCLFPAGGRPAGNPPLPGLASAPNLPGSPEMQPGSVARTQVQMTAQPPLPPQGWGVGGAWAAGAPPWGACSTQQQQKLSQRAPGRPTGPSI